MKTVIHIATKVVAALLVSSGLAVWAAVDDQSVNATLTINIPKNRTVRIILSEADKPIDDLSISVKDDKSIIVAGKNLRATGDERSLVRIKRHNYTLKFN
jgi:hypothetical protein